MFFTEELECQLVYKANKEFNGKHFVEVQLAEISDNQYRSTNFVASAWGDKANMLANTNPGNTVKVKLNISGKVNDKGYPQYRVSIVTIARAFRNGGQPFQENGETFYEGEQGLFKVVGGQWVAVAFQPTVVAQRPSSNQPRRELFKGGNTFQYENVWYQDTHTSGLLRHDGSNWVQCNEITKNRIMGTSSDVAPVAPTAPTAPTAQPGTGNTPPSIGSMPPAPKNQAPSIPTDANAQASGQGDDLPF